MIHIKNSVLYFAAAMVIAAGTVSCSDDIELPAGDQGKYENVGESFGYVRNGVTYTERLVDLYQEDVERAVVVGLTERQDRIVEFTLAVSEQALQDYNARNGFSYQMLPASLVTLESGTVSVAPGYLNSEPVGVTISPSAELTEGATYVVPIRISTSDTAINLTDEQKDYFFFVKAQGNRLNPAKNAGFKIVSCMETGDADPRINLEFWLEKENKLFIDMVILFSANMNYNASTGRVYVHMNESIVAILNNREKYLKPLQDAGIKVVLGIMGNHDPAGIGYMADETNLQFIEELSKVLDIYQLDGVFWDDEYTAANPSIPGFISSSYESTAHLLYHTKKANPDKLSMVYQYANMQPYSYQTGYFPLPAVEGVDAANYLDYVICDYGAGIRAACYPGLTNQQGMPYPAELTGRSSGTPSMVKSGGWGGMMIFALSEHRDNFESFGLPTMRTIASTLFNDNLIYTGVSYEVEW